MILAMREWPLAPKMIFSTYGAYFSAIEPYRENFPVITGELGPTFTGCYTSQSKMKMANRIAEDRLYMAEALTAFAVSKIGIADFNTQFPFCMGKGAVQSVSRHPARLKRAGIPRSRNGSV